MATIEYNIMYILLLGIAVFFVCLWITDSCLKDYRPRKDGLVYNLILRIKL